MPRAGKVALWFKMHATKPDSPGWSPWDSHVGRRGTTLAMLSIGTHMYIYIDKIN